MEHPFTWYSILPYPFSLLPEHSLTALLAMVVILLLAYIARRSMARSQDSVIPEEGISVRNLMEFLLGLVVSLSDSVIGKKGRKYVSLFGSFFLFILFANLLGLIPGFSPPTSNLNTTLGLALVSFGAYNFFGFKENGLGYIKQFTGPMTSLPSTRSKIMSLLFLPVLLLSILFFFVLEGSSHLFRPVSLSLRLFGNMFGDHQVLEAFIELTKIVIPVLFYILGALVSVIQAFVFTVLSVIYVALAISHEH
ncbi:MAG TPA: FoF1 ATP synthase subunit a [Candidatus Binatia bacterium]|jgi:F-type H+-transporting ATPase subunit a|nr:FoF1 ATP synthase subunit a [Candidatus Binatia bacterium]